MIWFFLLIGWFLFCGIVAALVLGRTPWFSVSLRASFSVIFICYVAGVCLLMAAVLTGP